MNTHKGKIGSSFVDFLQEQGTYEETTAVSIKRVIAWQLEQAMAEQKISKNKMAEAMQTSRSQLDRILDPAFDTVQLNTLINAARVLGREIKIELV